jgi:hypothetical protein
MKKNKWEKIYFAVLAAYAFGILIYKYLAWGCVVICGDWYDR